MAFSHWGTRDQKEEWNQKLTFLISELSDLPQDEQKPLQDKIARLKSSITRYSSKDAANYHFISAGMEQLETDITKFVWKTQIVAMRSDINNFPPHIKSSFNARLKPLETNIKNFKLVDGNKNAINALLDQIGEDISARLKLQLDAENIERKTAYVTPKPNRSCCLFRWFQSDERNERAAKEMEDVTMRLLAP